MFEFLVLLVICVGFCRRRGERWEWSRERLRSPLDALPEGTRSWLSRGRHGGHGLLRQTRADMASLVDDLLGLLHPKARQQLERRARTWIDGARDRREALGSSLGSSLVSNSRLAVAGPGDAGPGEAGRAAAIGEIERLQRRYLEGRITLERYRAESDRLRERQAP